MKNRRLLFWMLFFLISSIHGLYASDTLVLKDPNSEYFQYQFKNDFLEVLEDSSNRYSFNTIQNAHFLSASSIDKKQTGTFWVKVLIRNESSPDLNWMILQGDPHVGVFEFYAPDSSGHYQLFNTGGSELPFYLRKYSANSIASELPIRKGETKCLYFRFHSHNEFAFKLLVQTTTFYTYYTLSEYFFLGLYYGILLIMAIYNLSIFFSVKDKIYLFYVGYVFSVFIFNTANDTMGFQFLWPWFPEINHYAYYFGQLLLVWTILLYSNSFMNLQQRLPVYFKIILASSLVFTLQFFLEYTILHTNAFYFTSLIPFGLIYFAAFKIFHQGYKPARFFIAGFSAVLVGLVFFILMERGIVPAKVYTVYAFNMGLLIEVFFFSRAIGDRFRFLKMEKESSDKKIIEQLTENQRLKDEINQELEIKVRDRTSELASAKGELEIAYEKIKQMNSLLKEDNEKLQYDVKELARARLMLRGVKFEEFCKIYPTDDACHKFLSELKWRKGYACEKCKNTKYSEGKSLYSRKCTKCNYDESAVMNTIFSRVKFPLSKAFYILFLYVSSKEKLTSTRISQILKLRQKTCWSFLQKIKEMAELRKNANKAIEKWTDLILE